jgi:D-sedoheptulose 7-phosphate isomerase
MADAERALRDHAALVEQAQDLLPQAAEVARVFIQAFGTGGRVYSFGNGGSAADAQHLAAELIGRYKVDRRPLPAQSFATDPSTITCISNDFAFEDLFARQVEAFVRQGDVVVGFTTSGRSANVVRGLEAARGRGATTILFAGGDGAPATEHADHALVVPSAATARVQEVHLLLLHLLVEQVDRWAAEDGA